MAVLQFGASAAGPYWHLAAFPIAATPTVQTPGEEEPAPLGGQHDEQACIVCQSGSAAGVLPAPTLLPLGVVAASGERPEPAVSPLRATPSEARARAPPFA